MFRTLVPALVALAVSTSALRATTAAVDHPGALPILLGVEKVRDELKLTSLQRAVLDSLRAEYKTEARKLVNPLPVTPAERSAAEAKLLKLNEKYNARALATLNDSQKARFVKIEHLVLGATLLYSPKVQKELALSPKQISSIEAIRQQGVAYVGSVNNRFENGKIGYHERLELLRDRRLSQGESLLKVLTVEQRSAFLAASGKKAA